MAGQTVVGPANGSGSQFEPLVVGLTATGSRDLSFGTPSLNGVVFLASFAVPVQTGVLQSVVMTTESGGGVLLAISTQPANSAYRASLVRLTADGVLAPGFGSRGVAEISGGLHPLGVSIEGDGKIVVTGFAPGHAAPVSPTTFFAAGRFLADGTADASFGQRSTPGVAFYPTRGQGGRLTDALFDAAGRIVLVGSLGVPVAYGSGLLGNDFAVFRAEASATVSTSLQQPPADLLGTGQTDLAVYLPASGSFAALPATGGPGLVVPFGTPGAGKTLPAVADYDGLGHAQVAAYLPDLGVYAVRSASGVDRYVAIGSPGAGQSIPAPADYEGIGKADVAVYDVASGTFLIRPADGSTTRTIRFGTSGPGQSIPAPADYYRTGQADVAVYLERSGAFAVLAPDGKSGVIVPFGKPGLRQSIPVPGDYDGSGHVELAVYIPSLGSFFYRPAGGGPDVRVPFGIPGAGEVPVVGDYDGSGRAEFAVYDPTRGFLAYRPAYGAADVLTFFGTANQGSVPVAAPPGALSSFGGSGSGSGSGIRAASLGQDFGSATPATPVPVFVTQARPSGVLRGFMVSPPRVARLPVNQAIPGRPGLLR